MLQQQRHTGIQRTLRQDGPVSVSALAERFHASPATIRRDLIQLEHQGVVHRVHGGAMIAPDVELPFDQVAAEDQQDREAVARAGVDLVRDGEVLLLDIGTTTHRVAGLLRGRAVTVLTSSLAVYEELVGDSTVQLVLLGGMVRRNYRSMVGFLTEDALRQVRADRLFLGTSGVRPDGSVMDDTTVEVPLKRAMLQAADQVILLADWAKFPGHGMARVCGPERLHAVVTNDGVRSEALAAMRDSGVEVIRCGS